MHSIIIFLPTTLTVSITNYNATNSNDRDKKLGVPILTKEQEKQTTLNFGNEIKMYNEISLYRYSNNPQ